jgi:hypothetical protein
MKRGRELDVGRVRELSGGWALIQLEFRNWHDAEGEKWAGCNPALRWGEERKWAGCNFALRWGKRNARAARGWAGV